MNTHTSPDQKHRLTFTYEGEIRFGPEFYTVKLDGMPISERIFGDYCLWQPNSRMVALQEWLKTGAHLGVVTALTLIDLQEMKLAQIPKVDMRRIFSVRFENESIRYREKQFWTTVEREIKLDDIHNWQNFTNETGT